VVVFSRVAVTKIFWPMPIDVLTGFSIATVFKSTSAKANEIAVFWFFVGVQNRRLRKERPRALCGAILTLKDCLGGTLSKVSSNLRCRTASIEIH